MELSAKAVKIKAGLDQVLAETGFTYNPDTEVVNRVLNGLAKRKEKTGKAYCPCRLVTGDEKEDDKIICPCLYHQEEIEEQGLCHCKLLVKRK